METLRDFLRTNAYDATQEEYDRVLSKIQTESLRGELSMILVNISDAVVERLRDGGLEIGCPTIMDKAAGRYIINW